jgi:phage protein D
MTGSVLNLNRARKALDRAKEKAQADANATKHGRTKAQRLLEAAQAEKARRALDQSKFEDE